MLRLTDFNVSVDKKCQTIGMISDADDFSKTNIMKCLTLFLQWIDNLD